MNEAKIAPKSSDSKKPRLRPLSYLQKARGGLIPD